MYGSKCLQEQDNRPQGRKTCISNLWCKGHKEKILELEDLPHKNKQSKESLLLFRNSAFLDQGTSPILMIIKIRDPLNLVCRYVTLSVNISVCIYICN